MSTAESRDTSARKPLRLWPGIAIAAIMLTVWIGAPLLGPDYSAIGMLGAVGGGALLVLWWLLVSRAPWIERLGALALIVLAIIAIRPLVHESISGAAMGYFFYIFSIPNVGLAILIAALATRGRSASVRRAAGAAAIVLGCALWMLLRTGGVSGSGGFDFHWRWTPTPEERLLAQAQGEPVVVPAPAAAPAASQPSPAATPMPDAPADAPATDAPAAAVATPFVSSRQPEWPGFRGAGRDSIVRGTRVDTDWTRARPVEMWRRPIGPGWSSFAVDGDIFYTQEQRGEEEIVAAYKVSTGQPVWRHRDPVRFYESNGGPGPRSTPTLHRGRVYTMGATGIVNALDAATGARVWSRNASTDTGRKIPIWGFSSSPLIVDDMVIVAAAGQVIAYDMATGKPRWNGPNGLGGYSSPHLVTIDGVRQVVHLSSYGARAFSPADGTVLWEHAWEGTPIVQPSMVDGDVLVTTADMNGGLSVKRLDIAHSGNSWSVSERWNSRGLKPYFNDYVVHNGHAYGFDGSILSCIDLATGERKWKGGRYGNGQMVLLADQDLLLVLSEDGELALVAVAADKYTELAKMPALNAKTWNHPVLVGDRLLIRNGEEMVAYRLGTAGS